jgi:hypothetical protein
MTFDRWRLGLSIRVAILSHALLTTSLSASAFSNMDFEGAGVPPDSTRAGSVATSLLFPSWTLRFDDTIQQTASLNGAVVTGTSATLYTSGATTNILQGAYSVDLISLFASVSLAQVGDVPVDAQSIRFLARLASMPGPLVLTMNSQAVPLAALSQQGDIYALGGDISSWAGRNAELRLTLTGIPVQGKPGGASLDAFVFSPQPIPEPNAILLASSCGVMIFGRKRWGRTRMMQTELRITGNDG